MASSPSSFALLMAAGLLFCLCSASDEKTCSSRTFDQKNYTNCVDLPYLKAYLHWTYDESNSSLAVAFTAPPAEPDGWVGWGINPTGTGMIGTQAFISFKLNGTYVTGLYNITSYASVFLSILSLENWDREFEEFNGNYTLFATVRVPATANSVNLVWQTGPKVNQSNGNITPHSVTADHLSSRGVLNLTAADFLALGPLPPSPSPPPRAGSSTPPHPSNGGGRIRATTFSFTRGYLLLAALLPVFFYLSSSDLHGYILFLFSLFAFVLKDMSCNTGGNNA